VFVTLDIEEIIARLTSTSAVHNPASRIVFVFKKALDLDTSVCQQMMLTILYRETHLMKFVATGGKKSRAHPQPAKMEEPVQCPVILLVVRA